MGQSISSCPSTVYYYTKGTSPASNATYTPASTPSFEEYKISNTTFKKACKYEISNNQTLNSTTCSNYYISSGNAPNSSYNSPVGIWNSNNNSCTFYLNGDKKLRFDVSVHGK